MFVYQVSTGKIWRIAGIDSAPDGFEQVADTGMYGQLLGTGYSGRNFVSDAGHINGRNEPALESVSNIGPIPRGNYTIGRAEFHSVLGPVAMPLSPDPDNKMYGRGDFWIHGDNVTHDASHGCIVLGPMVRHEIAEEVEVKNDALLVLA